MKKQKGNELSEKKQNVKNKAIGGPDTLPPPMDQNSQVPPSLVQPMMIDPNRAPSVPTPSNSKVPGKDNKKKQDMTKMMDDRPVEDRPDDWLEKIDLNDGEIIIEDNSTTKVFVAPCSNLTEQHEDEASLEIARRSKYLEKSHSEGCTASTSLSIRKNVLNFQLCRKVFDSSYFCRNITLSGEAQQALSEGIQFHLKNILDDVIKLCSDRKVESEANYPPTGRVLESLNNEVMGKVALNLGPCIKDILNEEETNARKFFQHFSKDDDKKLESKILTSAEHVTTATGNKRKLSETQLLDSWMQQDVSQLPFSI